MKSIRRVSWAAVGFTYFLMFWGNLVSSTGAGLACPDWPLCHGTILPPIRWDIVLEWGHRILAASAGALILVLVFQILRSREPGMNALKQAARVLVALLIIQIGLGGVTVLLGLSPLVSTIHLLVATTVFSGLIT